VPLFQIDGPRLDIEQKRELAKRITDVAMDIYKIPHITIIIRENSTENVASNGELIIDKQNKDRGE
jgi:4-oxalocrotonate tautomerase